MCIVFATQLVDCVKLGEPCVPNFALPPHVLSKAVPQVATTKAREIAPSIKYKSIFTYVGANRLLSYFQHLTWTLHNADIARYICMYIYLVKWVTGQDFLRRALLQLNNISKMKEAIVGLSSQLSGSEDDVHSLLVPTNV